MPRFAILEHTGAPDDPAGRHFDLLIETGASCRTWRLVTLPEPGGPPVAAVELPPHRLAWLDHEAGEVSGGRGFARRVDAGTCKPRDLESHGLGTAPVLVLEMAGLRGAGRLRLERTADGWAATAPGP
ncbi:MAG: hypothetical protein ACKOB1_08135 [Planctomycetia bacterium]